MTACRCKNLQAVFIKRKKKQKKPLPLRSEESHTSHNFTLFFSLKVQINLLDSIHLLIVLLLTL